MTRRQLAWLALPIAVGLAARIWVAEALAPVGLLGDEVYYVEVAANIARGKGHHYPEVTRTTTWAYRPPAHSALLAPALVGVRTPVRPADLGAARGIELTLGTLLVAATALLGWVLFDLRVGVAAGLIAALQPTLITFSHDFWSENLFALLVTAGLGGAVRCARRPGWGWALTTGLLFGAAALTREIALPVAATVVAWLCLQGWRHPAERRGLWRASLWIAIGAAAVVLPWTWRNYRVLDRFVPVSTVGWFAFAEGNVFESPDWMAANGPARKRFKADFQLTQGEVARMDLARARAFELIAAEQPAWLAKKLARNLVLLLTPDSNFFYKIRLGRYGGEPKPWLRPLIVASVAGYVCLLGASCFGIAQADGSRRRGLALGVFGVVAALHVVGNSSPRFRMPWLPLIDVYAGYALVRFRAFDWRSRLRVVAPLLVWLAFVATCVPHFASGDGAKTWRAAEGRLAGR